MDFTQDVQISEPFDLSDTLPTLCEPYKLIAKANQIDFSVEIHEGCPLDLPKRNLEKILANLLSNAVSYTKPGSKVSVVLYADRIMIENECTPIPQETLSHLFEPFYRPDFARNRQDGGNGLGLYIVSTLSKAILADEPTGNLDEDTAQDIAEILKESAHKMNKCVVVVTHSNELAKQADIVLRLIRGKLQMEQLY